MPRILMSCLAAAGLFTATAAFADSPFDGTWKGDPTSAQLDVKPDVFSIQRGMYECKSCLPPFAVKADGTFQKVTGKPYWDEISVKVVDDHNVAYQYRKGGKVIAESTQTVSADGKSLALKGSNTNNAAGVKIDQSMTETRVTAPIAGAHLISGGWKPDPKATSISDNGVTLTLKVANGMFDMSSPIGETLHAKIGGDFTANVGDPGKTLTKVEMPTPRSIRLTDKRDDKIVQVSTYTLNADGSGMEGAWMDPRDGSKGTFKITKQ